LSLCRHLTHPVCVFLNTKPFTFPQNTISLEHLPFTPTFHFTMNTNLHFTMNTHLPLYYEH
jgi:hypothetical protein